VSKKSLRSVKHYESTSKKIDKIKRRYKLTTPKIIERLLENIASQRDMDDLFGYPFCRIKKKRHRVEVDL